MDTSTIRTGRTADTRVWRGAIAVLATLVLLAGGVTGCDWPANTRYVHQVFADVDVTSNVTYRSTTTYLGAAIDLRLDIYEPRGDTLAERPAVMWMFGGGWISGNKSSMDAYARDSARRGYVGVSIQYRIRPGDSSDLQAAARDAYDDAMAAVAWLKANAATYRIDPDAIVAGGYSAGAINAVHLLHAPGTWGGGESPVAGAVAVAGMSFVLAKGDRPPLYMHHGTADPTVQYAWGTAVCDRTVDLGGWCEMRTIDGGTHSIFSTHRTEILDATGRWIFERVLRPLGYTAVQIPPA